MKVLKRISLGVAVALLGLSLVACGKGLGKEVSGYEKTVKTLCDAKVDADLDEFMTLFGSMESLMREVVTQEVLDKTKNNYAEACGDNMSAKYEITDEQKVSDEDVSGFQSTIAMFGETGEIEEAYNLEVDVTVKGDKGDYDYEMSISVGKVNNDWIIVNFNDTLLK